MNNRIILFLRVLNPKDCIFRLNGACISMKMANKSLKSAEVLTYSNIKEPNLSPLKSAPHTFFDIMNNNFDYPLSVAFPIQSNLENANRYIAPVGRVDNAFGDRNFVCSCLPIEEYAAK